MLNTNIFHIMEYNSSVTLCMQASDNLKNFKNTQCTKKTLKQTACSRPTHTSIISVWILQWWQSIRYFR